MALFALPTACRIEEGMIFHPSPTVARTPRQVGLQFEDIFFTTRDGVRLNGWFIPHRQARSTLVWFHGNAGNISHRVDNIKLLHDKVKVNVFIFDYRGYGLSEGRASEAGTYLDGEAAVDLLRKKLGANGGKTILFGRSLGAAVAAEMATRFDSQGLILESPFISIAEMARIVLPFLPIGSLLQTRYDVVAKIKQITVPLLVLHGDRDEIVPFSHGKAVFDAAPEPKRFFAIAGASHNDTYIVGGDNYFQQLKEFIDWAEAKASRPKR
ncbi:MAG: alpha/beta hydrolase [Candidatus Binatia bacterium]